MMAKRKTSMALTGGMAVAAALTFGAGAAQAVAPGAVGQIAYVKGGDLYIANPDGSGARAIVTGGVTGTTAWFSSGTRVAYVRNGNIYMVQYDGTDAEQVTTDGTASQPAVQQFAVRSIQPMLNYVDDGEMCRSSIYAVGFDHYCSGQGSGPATAVGNLPQIAVDASGFLGAGGVSSTIQAASPDVAPDGSRIAYTDPASGQVFAVPITFDSSTYTVSYGTPVQVTADSSADSDPRYSPDGKEITYTNGGDVREIAADAVQGAGNLLIAGASGASWQPVTDTRVVRMWGSNAIETAIATSQGEYKTLGVLSDPRNFATGVVLSRSDQFYDALAGSAFAAAKHAPLLLTHTASLDAPVLAEIERVLPKNGPVYLLGGTSAISPEVQAQLKKAGYTDIQRFAGSNMYQTAVLVDEAEFPQGGESVMVATGSSYYDALAAASISTHPNPSGFGDAAIVLAQGDSADATLPPATLDYLNSIAPTYGMGDRELVGVGGPGANAITKAEKAGTLHNWGKDAGLLDIVGSDAVDTAVKLAGSAYWTGANVGLATTGGWQDALAGGALLGSEGGDLLLTAPSGLNAEDAAFLAHNSISTEEVDVFGGAAALPASVITAVNPLLGVPGSVTDISFTPGSTPFPPVVSFDRKR